MIRMRHKVLLISLRSQMVETIGNDVLLHSA